MNDIEFQSVSFSYGGRLALQDVNLEVPRGSIFALIGPNGAGKSTSLSLITTLLAPSRGMVRVGGHHTVEQADQVRRIVGYAPEEPVLFSGLTAREFLELSATLHGMEDEPARRGAAELLELFGLSDRADEVIASFSKGMRRKTLLGAALVHDPAVLVLDEPLEGLDVGAQVILKDLLRRRVAEGRTVLYSTHVLEVIESLCTHVGVLRQGRLLGQGKVDEVCQALGVSRLEDVFRQRGEENAGRGRN